MSRTDGTDRVSNKQLYDELQSLRSDIESKHPTRLEMRLTVAIGLVTGSATASVVTAFITGLKPHAQVTTLAHLLAHLV